MPRKSARGSTTSAQGMVKDLVGQFSDPLDFYRELIQNAIDAGSNRIDVALEAQPLAKGRVLATVSVEDDGEGMDEVVIDDYLLVLFKSTKEDDLTKIGKFGIGFVSVFAPKPQLVRLYTAKNGESWRLDFPSYKKYEKYRMPQPREGTRVELHKEMSAEEYARFAEESLTRIRHWCKHAETRIYFSESSRGASPSLVNEPFALEGESLRYREEGTEIAMAFSADPEPFYGFYNRGLTLKEGKKAFVPGVALKVKSRYLEHTITRDNVMEDDNYRKALGIVMRLAKDELPERLRAELAEIALNVSRCAAAGDREGVAKHTEEWGRRLPFLRWLFGGFWSRWRRSDWKIFPGVAGEALSIHDVHEAIDSSGGKLYFEELGSPVARELAKRGIMVLAAGPWLNEVNAWGRAGQTAKASTAFILPKVLKDEDAPLAVRSLLTTLRWADSQCGAKYQGILAADFTYPDSSIQDRIFVTQKEPGALGSSSERPRSSLLWLRRRRLHALLNTADSFVEGLAALHETRPGLAAYLCLKVMHLSDGEVPSELEDRYCNLAEKLEQTLLETALRLDAASALALGQA
ncbi:MAG: ATP-binding protein [Elusimicrobia bacterium]|nr:ATP-binding protein [Elusimicrobiota bacterium]